MSAPHHANCRCPKGPNWVAGTGPLGPVRFGTNQDIIAMLDTLECLLREVLATLAPKREEETPP